MITAFAEALFVQAPESDGFKTGKISYGGWCMARARPLNENCY